jgi:hypothetical protein
MNEHLSETRLHDYVDGLLTPEEVRALEEHLESCAECREVAVKLSEVVAALGALPVEATPERDLWGGIESRIAAMPRGTPVPGYDSGADHSDPAVISLDSHRGRSRSVTLTVSQLLAASITLIALSAGAVWTILGSGPAATVAPVTNGGNVSMVSTISPDAAEDYDTAVEELEAILREGRTVLDPATVIVLEESLREIDEAIDEARAALAADPGSTAITRVLTQNMRRKLGILRQAAGIIQAST